MGARHAPQVRLYVRSLASRTGRQDRIIERLQRLDAADRIDALEVRVWGTEVGLSTTAVDTARGREILDTVADLREWANREGVSLDGVFENRQTTSAITGEEYTTLRLPALVLAERVGGEVVEVRPHEAAGELRTVEQRLTALAERAARSVA